MKHMYSKFNHEIDTYIAGTVSRYVAQIPYRVKMRDKENEHKELLEKL